MIRPLKPLLAAALLLLCAMLPCRATTTLSASSGPYALTLDLDEPELLALYTFTFAPPMLAATVTCPGQPTIPIVGYGASVTSPFSASYDYLTAPQVAALDAGQCALIVSVGRDAPPTIPLTPAPP